MPEWDVLPSHPEADAISRTHQIFRPIAQVLAHRGFTSENAAEFLTARLWMVHSPRKLAGAHEAAERILRSAMNGKIVCIYGDYDVDGTTGTAILLHAMRSIGHPGTRYYIPHRVKEGYGVHIDAIRNLAADGVETIVTVDCGITGVEAAEEANRLGLEWIVTDHHAWQDALPEASAVVHPRRPDQLSPWGHLCGAGVAWKVAWSIYRLLGNGYVPKQHIDTLTDCMALAALGTVADVVPILEENRAIVRCGVRHLQRCELPGVKALLATSGIEIGGKVTSEDIGFRIGPRINAAGRLDHGNDVVELLTTRNIHRAYEIASHLDALNVQRKAIESAMVDEASAIIEYAGILPGIVVVLPNGHPGVMGIVASRIAEKFNRPTLIVCGNGEILTGSARSIPGFNLYAALQQCRSTLLRFGGHEAAAGFRVKTSRIPALAEQFANVAASVIGANPQPQRLRVEAEISLDDLRQELIDDLERLEPFGAGNPRPRFLIRNVTARTPSSMGGDMKHLSFSVMTDDRRVRCVYWNASHRIPELMSVDGLCSLVASPRLNNWKGKSNIELEVIDFKPGPWSI